jgi:quinoprotein glucose dehydrogenase
MNFRSACRLAAFALAWSSVLNAAPPVSDDDDDESGWGWYGGDRGGNRYSELEGINRDNVAGLEPAWTYRTGELGAGLARQDKLTFEATPILVSDTLYLSTATNIVIALDAATGRPRWRYDPKIPRDRKYSEVSSRGVAYWRDGNAKATTPCGQRIFIGTLDARLIALDAYSGSPCPQFGTNGSVDLTSGVRLRDRNAYSVTSPPTVYRDLVIVGAAIGDNRAVDVERGVVRAFDAHTGALVWAWDPLPSNDNEAKARGWSAEAASKTGAANAWSMFSVDPARGLVYIPTGSASPDFYGGERLGDNDYANSIVALHADTGKLAWYHQLVHHDLWDYDVPAQPMLVDIDREGESIPAVIQATKMGMLFGFNRESGSPIFDIVERNVPVSDVPGERTAPTQPFPATPALVSQAAITPEEGWGLTFYDRIACRNLIKQYRSQGIYTPPSLHGSIESPGYAGGINWGGLAFDSERQYVVAAVNNIPTVVTLVPRDKLSATKDSKEFQSSEFAEQAGTPYGMRREPLLSPFGLPCTAPPWGTLAAIDLRRNSIKWQVMLGSTRDRAPWFVPSRTIGMPNMGGPIITAGGLVFIGAASDDYLRAFDIDTGHELWKGRLPAGGQATPMTYEINQRQFVVIAAGGHGGLGTHRGDYVVAFALPRRGR